MRSKEVRLVILVIAAVLFVILTFITDFMLYFLLAFIMCIVSWLLVRTGQRSFGQLLTLLGAAFVVVPFIVILIVLMVQLQLHPKPKMTGWRTLISENHCFFLA